MIATRHPRNRTSRLVARPLLLALAFAASSLQAAQFNYHGELLDGGQPAAGAYDLRIRTFAQPDAKQALGATVELPGVQVVDGAFAVELDLAESKIGDTYVEVAVRRNGSTDDFEVLGVPQKFVKANNGCWALDGNTGMAAGSFVGIADPASTMNLELRARNQAVVRYSTQLVGAVPITANVIAGSPVNSAFANVRGATVSGGGAPASSDPDVSSEGSNQVKDSYGTVGGGADNSAGDNSGSPTNAPYATVGGGHTNDARGNSSTVAGGSGNTANGHRSTVGGGSDNYAGVQGAVVGGGADNRVNGIEGTVAGGNTNSANGVMSTVPGGFNNCAGGDYSFAGGSWAAVRTGNEGGDASCVGVNITTDADGDEGTFVWADSQTVTFASSGPDQFLIRATGGVGINTATMGAATNLRLGEMVLKNPPGDANTDITLLNATNRGYGIASIPGTSGNPGEFYLSEIDARTGTVGFALKLRINVDGTTSVIGGAVSSISDARVKKNIAAIDKPLDTLLALRGHSFEYIDPAAAMSPPGTRIGFVAQEVREVLPQWITNVGGEYLGVQTSGFEALAVEAIRDLKTASDARIESLEQDNAALRAQLEQVLSRLAKIESRHDD